ncbi:SMP-30/gluconolactonase/LRE family protein [Paracraurococcus lichenis]|uniref:SMP-30/gluconolactonase/LRE family protein n=1 Tax=Paracraurococcus lichenis TaxID=3064888 RepID=A0ABT9E3Z5_9PROT|nr:SMP-30/gluconolactonase/LRE family protein [Paracraurococcus sp. LOR1-02]MDO9710889.1 SMP-30/gluconolactonase/LRE family protein [Paracraurococcus sp. LOR1-02]
MQQDSRQAARWDSGAPIRYPDPDVLVLDPRFEAIKLGHAAIERIATGFRFTEGPIYYGDGRYLLFSDIPNDALLRWDEITGAVATLRQPAGYPDGNTRDRQGRLVTCELGTRRLTRTEHDGTVTVLAEAFGGTRLTGPNDVVVKSDGTIWFSDNGAGIRGNYLGDKAPQELPFRVYRYDPASGGLSIAIDDMARPNGLCFSPDERRLYVVDTPGGPRITRVYDIEDGRAVNGRLFFDDQPGWADGIRCDTEGNVWAGMTGGPGRDGVAVFAPDGTLIGRILLPERCANLCFGGRKRNRLFMTASQSVYALYVEAQGCPGG